MSTVWNEIADTFRRRARRIVGMRGIACVGIVIVLTLWTIGLIDWMLRWDSPWIRWAVAIGFVATVTTSVRRFLIRPLMTRLSDVDIARTIERCDPEWGDRLSSAAQFREARGNPELGSSPLQRAVIADVDAQLPGIELQHVFETTPTKRLIWMSAAVCVAGVIGAMWQHTASVTVLSRIAMPFTDIGWPRSTELQFLDADLRLLGTGPHRTAAGEPFPLYVENRLGSLPESATLILGLADGRTEKRAIQVTMLRDESGATHEVGIATLTAHQGPIRFRAVAGDDTEMPWKTLDVIPAPAVASVTITITPPEYAQRETKTLEGAGAVEALIGSEITFSGEANKPLASAWLRREGQPPQPMALNEDAQRFVVKFTIEEQGHSWFWFDLKDEFGLGPSDPPRYEVRGIADRQPVVFLDEPAGDITVTPDADVTLRIVARDDLGIASLHLVHSRPDVSQARQPLATSVERPTEEIVEFAWALRAFGLHPGDRVTYHAEAVDAFDLRPQPDQYQHQPTTEFIEATDLGVIPQRPAGQMGTSAHRHIDVVSPDEKAQELASRQIKILDSLQELQDRQSQVLESTAGLRIQAELTDSLSSDDLDLLKQTELDQQSIRDVLAKPPSGVAHEVESIRQELQQNHIHDPQLADRLTRLDRDFQTLSADLLPAVEQSLVRARKLMPSSPDDDRNNGQGSNRQSHSAQAQEHLRQAERAQSAAVAVMKAASEDLGNWRRRYEVLSELDDLIVDQTDIQQQTQDVGRETATSRRDDLTARQQANLARLSDRQERLADRLDELIRRGTKSLPDGESPTPAMTAVQEALKQLAQRRTAESMHHASQSLKRNELVQTAQAQRQVLNDLRGFGDLLYPADERASETLLATLDRQTETVESLTKQQTQLAESSRQAWETAAGRDRLERLMKQQEQLAQQADALAQQLRGQQNRRSAQSAARAARRMRQARDGMEQNQPQQTATSQLDALDDLQQLADELAQQRRQIEQRLAQQQVEQLTDELQTAADRQETLIAATAALDARQQQRGSWSRSLKKELRESTDEQAALADQLDELRSSLSGFPVIDVSLERAVEPMRSAVQHMAQSDVSAPTVELQRVAHRRLLDMVAAARTSDGEANLQAADNTQPQIPASLNQEGQQSARLVMTQLRLLRQLQSDVQTRTSELMERAGRDGTDPGALAAERDAVADDQVRIAELTRQLLEQFSDSLEEHP